MKIGELYVGNSKDAYSYTKLGWKGRLTKIEERRFYLKGEGNNYHNTEFSFQFKEIKNFDLLESSDGEEISITNFKFFL